MNYMYRCSSNSFHALCVTFLALMLLHTESAFAKGDEANPVHVSGTVTVDDGGGSLTVDGTVSVSGSVVVTDGRRGPDR